MKRSDYKMRVPDEIAALIKVLHPHLKAKIKAAFRTIISGPHEGKALKDELSGLRSFRVSRFRIIYRLARVKEIEIVAIGPREMIYEETLRILKDRIIS